MKTVIDYSEVSPANDRSLLAVDRNQYSTGHGILAQKEANAEPFG
jgi:hypothetical protein